MEAQTILHVPGPSDRALTLRQEAAAIVRLSGPLMAAQGGLMMMGVVDTLIIGHTGALEMSAVALGNAIQSSFVIFGMAAGFGAEPLIAQAHGAGDPKGAASWVAEAAALALLLSLPLMLLGLLSTQFLIPLGVPPAIATRAASFLWVRIPAIPLFALSVVFRSYLSCTARPRPVLLSVLIANLVNVGLDLWLIYGGLGVPALGAVGAGISTSTCNLILLLLWAAGAHQAAKGFGVSLWTRPTRAGMARVFKIGWPAGLQSSLEVGVFALVSGLIARFGEISLAGHQIAITLASLTFMSALGISNATTARVGNHIGAGQPDQARRSGLLGIAVGAGFMSIGGIGFICVPELLAGLFTSDAEVIGSAAILIRIAGAFAISDGVQVVSAGALRGAADTRWSLYTNLIAHWLVGLPIALWLGQVLGYGAAGYWWGLTVGLTGVAITLLARFWVISGRPLARA